MIPARKLQKCLLALALGGMTFQFGCSLTSLFRGFNPCGVILQCDPAEFAFAQTGFDVRDPELLIVDPFCTIPPFCDAAQDPVFGGLNDNP